MTKIENLLQDDITYTHSLKLLQNIIISIESYPELNKLKKTEELDPQTLNKDEYNKRIRLIKEEYEIASKQINSSNIKKIKELLIEIEKRLERQKNKTDENNITARLNYLKDEKLNEIYLKEQKFYSKKTEKLIRTLKSELEKINKSLPFYAYIIIENKNYLFKETLTTKETLSNFFEKIKIDTLIEDISLEDYLEEYYKQLGSDIIDIDFKRIYPTKNYIELDNLRIKKNPILKLVKLITPLSKENGLEIEKICQETTDLLIRIDQLNNLKTYLKKNNYQTTIIYIENQIDILKQKIAKNNATATKKWNNIISELSLKEKIKNKQITTQIKKLLIELLIITEQETKQRFNYNLEDNEYRIQIKDDMIKYQNALLKNKYGLNITVKEITNNIYPKTTEVPNKPTPKSSNPFKKIIRKTKMKTKI